MTELEFINTDPRTYGGANNANLLISSSVVNPGVDNTPVAPFYIQGLTIPFYDENGLNLQPTLKEVEEFRFDFTEGVVQSRVLDRQKRTGWYFFRIEQVVINTLPPVSATVGIGTPAEQDIYTYTDSNFIFIPYISLGFINNDYNALLNNAVKPKPNSVAQVVDRSSDSANPTNLQAVINLTATPADVQNCSYTKAGIINARYNGSKLTSGSIPGDDPALGLREFEGSIHSAGSDVQTIKNINLADRNVQTLYFNAFVSGSHPNKTVQTFPSGSNYIYQGQGNRFVRLVDRKIYSIEKGEVYITDQLGVVTGIT
jgi:hypothetical protein